MTFEIIIGDEMNLVANSRILADTSLEISPSPSPIADRHPAVAREA